MIRKFISSILMLSMLCAFAICVNASEIVDSGECGAQGDNVIWTLDSEGTLTISGTGEMVYSMTEYNGSVIFTAPWNNNRKDIINIVIEKGVNGISQSAFYECTNLKTITIPYTVYKIRAPFENCGKGFVIKGYENSAAQIYATNNKLAFESLGIMPRETLFSGKCGDDLMWNFDTYGTLSVTGTGKMYDYDMSDAAFGAEIRPPWISYMGNIKSINIGEGVTHIGDYSFYYSSIRYSGRPTSPILPETLKTIGKAAFYNMCDIENITFPEGLTDIGDEAFYFCGIKDVSFPNSLKTIGKGAFRMNRLRNIDLGNGVENIGANAFSGNHYSEEDEKLESITIPSSVKTMDAAFTLCYYLKEVNINEENGEFKSVDNIIYSKDGKKLIFCPINIEPTDGRVNIQKGTEEISDSAFDSCKNITEIIIPEGVTTLGNEFVNACENLKILYIPSTITNLYNRAFFSNLWYLNKEIPEIYFNGTEEKWKELTAEVYYQTLYGDSTIFHWNAIGINPPQIGTLTLGSSLSGGIADLIKVPLTDTEYDSEMITVFYKDGAMVDMQTTPVKSGDEMKDIPIPDNSGADSAKVFIWSSLDSMKPLCEAKKIKLTEEDI